MSIIVIHIDGVTHLGIGETSNETVIFDARDRASELRLQLQESIERKQPLPQIDIEENDVLFKELLNA